MRLSIIKLFGACSLLLLFSCSSSSTEELNAENQHDISTSSIEQMDNDAVPEQEIGPDTSNDTIAETSPEQESGADTSNVTNPIANPQTEVSPDALNNTNNLFSRRVSSMEYRTRTGTNSATFFSMMITVS